MTSERKKTLRDLRRRRVEKKKRWATRPFWTLKEKRGEEKNETNKDRERTLAGTRPKEKGEEKGA